MNQLDASATPGKLLRRHRRPRPLQIASPIPRPTELKKVLTSGILQRHWAEVSSASARRHRRADENTSTASSGTPPAGGTTRPVVGGLVRMTTTTARVTRLPVLSTDCFAATTEPCKSYGTAPTECSSDAGGWMMGRLGEILGLGEVDVGDEFLRVAVDEGNQVLLIGTIRRCPSTVEHRAARLTCAGSPGLKGSGFSKLLR